MGVNDCIIYCTSNISFIELKEKIAVFLEADRVQVSFIEKEFYEISLQVNDEFDSKKQVDFPDGFLYFKFVMDVGFANHGDLNQCIELISKILAWLWKIGIPAVASWDHEDSLPEKGGYKSKVVPWPIDSY